MKFTIQILAISLLLANSACVPKKAQKIPLPVVYPTDVDGFITPIVHFAKNSAVICPASYNLLQDVANIIKSNQNKICKVILEGHSDSLGIDSVNYKIALRRAQAVKQDLISRGVPSGLLEVVSHGESWPIDYNDNELGRAKNRRVELKTENCSSVESKPVLP